MKLFQIFTVVSFTSHSNLAFGALIRRSSEESNYVEDEAASSQHRQLTPLSCNDDVTWNCVPWSFGTSASDVVIPCGECYTMDSFVNNEVITLTGTLRVQGRLEFNDGTKVTLQTKGVLVEGELAMTSTKPVDGNPDIVIELTGTTAYSFPLHPDNAASIQTSTLSVEAKTFMVLGKLDINGLPDSCPTWSTIESFIGSGMVEATNYAQRPTLPVPSKGTCDYDLVKEAFENGLNGWNGNIGAEEYINTGSHDESNYMHITNRTATFQGPMLEVNRYLRECILPDTEYFFNAKIRLTPGPEAATGAVSDCSSSKLNCPQLRMSHMNEIDRVRWRTLAETKNLDFTDGAWVSVKASFRLTSDQLASTDVFTFLIVNGPEAGIDISIDDVTIGLPPAGAYPDPSNVCGELVTNGDASVLDGFAFPMRGYLWANPVFVKNDGDGNQYFSIANRKYAHDNLVFDIVPECLEENSIYSFSMKIRIHSAVPVVPNVILKFHAAASGQKPSFAFVARDCPATSTDIGWVTCTADMTFKAGHSSAPRVEVLVLIQDDTTSNVDYDDISFIHKSGAPSALRLHEVTQLENCWAPGADVALPSETLNFEQGHTATIEAIVDGNGVDLVETITPAPSSREITEDFAVEMALLSRNILFKSGDTTAVGPTLQLMYSGVAQKIQGVEFNGFGQEGKNGINPIYFAKGNDSTGSVIAKNSIRNSKNRCINLEETSNVLIQENVAYETKGHCYSMATSGLGVNGNVFKKNIGFVTRNSATPAPGTSDNQAATFFISNPSNSWIDNVAGGSNAYGFWFQLQVTTMKNPVTEFSGNTIHSSYLVGLKTFPQGLTPISPTTWTNSTIYRNRGHGIFLHNTKDVTLDGFLLADNKLSIDLYMADKIFITNSVIRGYTEDFERNVKSDPSKSMKHCWPKPDPSRFSPITGIRMHSNAKTVGYGTNVIANVTFSDFNPETGCNPSSAAISTNTDVRENKYTGLLALGSLTFESGTESANMISLCDAKANGVTDISIPDSAGSINPTDNTPGYIVTDTGNTECVLMANTCARYCTDANAGGDLQNALAGGSGSGSGSSDGITSAGGLCLSDKWVKFRANVFDPTTGPNGEAAIIAGDRVHQQLGGLKQDFASSCLTKDKSYEITADVKLTKKGTADIFPCNPAAQWNNDPESCAGLVLFKPPSLPLTEVGVTLGPLSTTGWNKLYGFFTATDAMKADSVLSLFVARAPLGADITLSNVAVKESTASWSSQCLKNGDFETGDHRFWVVRGSGPGKGTLSITDGYNSTFALRHQGKTARFRGVLQNLEPSCFAEKSTMVITAKFRYFDSSGNATECDKGYKFAANACPVFEFAPNGKAKGPMNNEDQSPMVAGEWNTIKHTITIDDEFKQAPSVWLFVNQVPAGVTYDLDDIVLE
jgi:hypothetical protein